jgi:myo-inositol-1(or 4)-monophosphatase
VCQARKSVAQTIVEALTSSIEVPALALAQELGRRAVEAAGTAPAEVQTKRNEFDLVTSVDRAIELDLRARIAETFPDHAVLGEEAGRGGGDDEWTWVLDPIDGTLNFATGLPCSASSIALLCGEEIRVGAVADLATGSVVSARLGGGLESDRGPLAPASSRAGESRLFFDYGAEVAEPELLDRLRRFAEALPVVPRLVGSAALALAAVAVGGGCFAGTGLRSWDVAGGLVLVTEAGGEARVWRDDPWLHVLAGDAHRVRLFDTAMSELIAYWHVRPRQEGELQ